MAGVVLIHHARGLTDGIRAGADRLRAYGHDVHTPDLYDGVVFDSTDEGVDHALRIGMQPLIERAAIYAAGYAELDAVIGISLGVVPAYRMTQSMQDIRACIGISGALSINADERPWPPQAALQLHLGTQDPRAIDEDLPVARELARTEDHPDGIAEVFEYDVDTHLFVDSSTEDYVPEAAELVLERAVTLLDQLESRH